MLEEISTKPGVSTQQAVRSLIIVARNQRDLWHLLVDEFKDTEHIQILLDRRHGQRRYQSAPGAAGRRTGERRSLPRPEYDLHARQYVLVRPHYHRPQD